MEGDWRIASFPESNAPLLILMLDGILRDRHVAVRPAVDQHARTPREARHLEHKLDRWESPNVPARRRPNPGCGSGDARHDRQARPRMVSHHAHEDSAARSLRARPLGHREHRRSEQRARPRVREREAEHVQVVVLLLIAEGHVTRNGSNRVARALFVVHLGRGVGEEGEGHAVTGGRGAARQFPPVLEGDRARRDSLREDQECHPLQPPARVHPHLRHDEPYLPNLNS
mmetsp:Transcript_1587/g.3712  ORF Transcript_1587/g.3712 Transcript_1587/m.3712 type:complete len:229 (-) Transcript_1587:348-1034(-)